MIVEQYVGYRRRLAEKQKVLDDFFREILANLSLHPPGPLLCGGWQERLEMYSCPVGDKIKTAIKRLATEKETNE